MNKYSSGKFVALGLIFCLAACGCVSKLACCQSQRYQDAVSAYIKDLELIDMIKKGVSEGWPPERFLSEIDDDYFMEHIDSPSMMEIPHFIAEKPFSFTIPDLSNAERILCWSRPIHIREYSDECSPGTYKIVSVYWIKGQKVPAVLYLIFDPTPLSLLSDRRTDGVG